jgi:hypothetical protein
MNECLEAGKSELNTRGCNCTQQPRYVHQSKAANETAVTRAARSLQLSLIFGSYINILDTYSRKVNIEATAVEMALLNNWLICTLCFVRLRTLLMNKDTLTLYIQTSK